MGIPSRRAAVGLSVAVAAAGGALVLTATAPPGGGDAPREAVTGAYVREPASPDVAAAYFTVHNTGGA